MGYSISQEIVVGFVVPHEWAFETGVGHHPPPCRCEHEHPEGAAFCSTCGKSVKGSTYNWRELRTDRGFKVDQDGAYEGPLLHLDHGVTVRWLPPGMSSEEIILAGIRVLSLGDARQGDHGGHEKYPVPEFVSEQFLANILKAAGVPFDETSFGLHLFTTAA